ncbi:copper resistance protein CopC [Nonomuraea angiospora]|uniref:Methionine-rich copper-binding protein CopC n=1 Tax=Nonomuraea angiospora TaxID=46172 RepID=A0ABR9MKJ9_9ACTN|nr:copper resistance protein CopC [Nonomuraea angiospora]MBE1593407.1 methionine-rich copper-binding protein CopC [Nonomuraea angiospora]
MTFLRRALVPAVGAVLVLLLTSPAALAHDRLKASNPTDRAELKSLETIELEFTSHMQLPTIVLDGPGGKPVPLNKPRVQGNKVFARPTDALPEGRYRIAWRVVSSDGHPIQGELAFTITAPAPSPSPSEETPTETHTETPTPASSPEPQPASAQPASAQPASAQPASSQLASSSSSSSPAAATRAGGTSGLPGWLWAALAVVLAGGAAVLFAARRKPHPDRG